MPAQLTRRLESDRKAVHKYTLTLGPALDNLVMLPAEQVLITRVVDAGQIVGGQQRTVI